MSNNWKERRSRVLKQMRNDWLLYLLLVPVLAWYIIFCYLPMAGVTLAFRDYSYKGGLWGSEWVGLANFTKMFSDPLFFRAVKNTIIFSLGRIAFQMPCAVLLAIALNELRLKWAKKTVQTIVTFPHFISWVVLAGMLMNIFGSTGTVNQILSALGVSNIAPITSSKAFRTFIWISGIWKEVGWDSIIYLAAITSIDPGLYEAAAVDGCTRLQAYFHIILPLARPGLIASGVYCFIISWNEFMFANNFAGLTTRTIPVAIAALETQDGLQVAEMCASCIVAILPVVLLSIFIKKYLVNGLTFGAVK